MWDCKFFLYHWGQHDISFIIFFQWHINSVDAFLEAAFTALFCWLLCRSRGKTLSHRQYWCSSILQQIFFREETHPVQEFKPGPFYLQTPLLAIWLPVPSIILDSAVLESSWNLALGLNQIKDGFALFHPQSFLYLLFFSTVNFLKRQICHKK